jgi:hypothetical protein
MKELWQSINKFHFTNFVIFSSVFLSILIMFFIQFKVENLQDEISKAESEISTYQDQIQLLEVEWVYLTRPERLRTLASRYLKDNGYALASQIKASDKFEQYHLVKYKQEIEEDSTSEVKQASL